MERARSPQPTSAGPAAGTLATTPLAHIFIHARQRELSGTLRLERDDEAIEIVIASGLLRNAMTTSGALSALPVARLIVRAFSFPPSTRFSFRPMSETPPHAGARPDLEPYALVWAGIRAHGLESTAIAVLQRLGSSPVVLANDVKLDRYGFNAEERRIAERLRTPGRPGTTRLEILLAYVLATTKGLVPSAVSIAPPGALAGSARATPDAKRFMTPPVGSARVPRISNNPQVNFQAAEIAFAQQDLERAERLCHLVREEAPRHAEAVAMLARLRVLRADGESPRAVKEALALLDEALDLHPGCERAYVYRAAIRKAAGDMDGAMADYRSACSLNPHNVDAARALRIHDMRAKHAAEEERKASGLFRRILGKP